MASQKTRKTTKKFVDIYGGGSMEEKKHVCLGFFKTYQMSDGDYCHWLIIGNNILMNESV